MSLKFTVEQCQDILYEGGVWEGDDVKYVVVSEEVVYVDQEKNSTDVEIVIEEIATGKYYKAEFNKSVWIGQDEYNAEQPWSEVKPKKKTITTFE